MQSDNHIIATRKHYRYLKKGIFTHVMTSEPLPKRHDRDPSLVLIFTCWGLTLQLGSGIIHCPQCETDGKLLGEQASYGKHWLQTDGSILSGFLLEVFFLTFAFCDRKRCAPGPASLHLAECEQTVPQERKKRDRRSTKPSANLTMNSSLADAILCRGQEAARCSWYDITLVVPHREKQVWVEISWQNACHPLLRFCVQLKKDVVGVVSRLGSLFYPSVVLLKPMT